jgi:HEAT repeat protein
MVARKRNGVCPYAFMTLCLLTAPLLAADSPLLNQVKSENEKIRSAAIEKAVALLRSGGEKEINEAIYALSAAGRPAVVPLTACLKDSDPALRGALSSVFSRIGRPAMEELLECVRSDEWRMSWTAGDVFSKMTKAAVPILIEELKTGKPRTKARAAEALGRIKDERAIEPLVRALAEEEWIVDEQARRALVSIGPPAVDALIEAFRNEGSGTKVRRLSR